LTIACSVPEILAIIVYICRKFIVLLTTDEPLHFAWWNFAHTCTWTTSGTLLNF